MVSLRRLAIVSLSAVLVGVAPSMAAAVQVVVIDHHQAPSGTIVLRPAVASMTADGAPAQFLIANEGTRAILATMTLSDATKPGTPSHEIADVHLAAGEAARVDVEAADVPGPVARLDVHVAGSDDGLVGWVVGRGSGEPVNVDAGAGDVLLSSPEPTVVTVQVRHRSWLSTVASHRVVGPLVLVGTQSVDAAREPWLPGPWWTDVHVTDHAGTTTSVSFRHGSVARDAAIAVVLLAVASLLLWRQARLVRSARKASRD